MNVIRYRHLYYLFSGLLVLGSIVAILVFGLRFGIEFTGGSILEIEYQKERPSNQEIRAALADILSSEPIIQPTGEKGVIIRMKESDEATHQNVLKALRDDVPDNEITELRFEAIGPIIGKELKEKTWLAIVIAGITILLYIALAFRGVSRIVSSWKYGLITAGVALHDVLIPLGVLAVLGRTMGVEVTIPVVAALLTVMGYSINDTIVVFDRVRENLLRHKGISFEDTLEQSLHQTWVRSVNTSLTTLFPLLAIFFLGGVTLKYFALVLIIGVISGTYSSIFLAVPILTKFKKYA